jgi:hypothetical protein
MKVIELLMQVLPFCEGDLGKAKIDADVQKQKHLRAHVPVVASADCRATRRR